MDKWKLSGVFLRIFSLVFIHLFKLISVWRKITRWGLQIELKDYPWMSLMKIIKKIRHRLCIALRAPYVGIFIHQLPFFPNVWTAVKMKAPYSLPLKACRILFDCLFFRKYQKNMMFVHILLSVWWDVKQILYTINTSFSMNEQKAVLYCNASC